MLAGPDPFGINDQYQGPYYPLPVPYDDPAYGPPPGYSDDSFSWLDIVSQGIGAARDVARVAVGGYPPQDIYAPVYAPQYPAQPDPRAVTPTVDPQAQRPGGMGLQISTPLLMLGAGAILLFMAGKRSR